MNGPNRLYRTISIIHLALCVFFFIFFSSCNPELPDKPSKLIVTANDLDITDIKQSGNCIFDPNPCEIILNGKASGEISDSTKYKIYAYYNSSSGINKLWKIAEPQSGIRAHEKWQMRVRLNASNLSVWDSVTVEIRVVAIANDANVRASFQNDDCPNTCSVPVSLLISKALLPPLDISGGSSLAVVPFKCYVCITNPLGPEIIFVHTCPSLKSDTTISVPTNPEGIAASPNGRVVYVCLPQEKTIRIINVDTKKETQKLKLTGEPFNIAVTPDGDYAYVTCPNQQQVYVIATDDKTNDSQYQVIDSVRIITGKPFDVAAGRFTKTAYVTDIVASKIHRIRPRAQLPPIDIGTAFARNIAVSPDERFAAATLQVPGQSISQPKVMLIDLSGGQPIVKRVIDLDSNPESLTITPNARAVLITEHMPGKVMIIEVPSNLDSAYLKYSINLSADNVETRHIAVDALMNRAYIINRPGPVYQLMALRLDLFSLSGR